VIRSTSRGVLGFALAVVGPAALSVVLIPLRGSLNLVSDALLFLLVAVGVGLVGGPLAAIAASLVGSAALNFFFTEPFHTLTVADPNNAVALLVFTLVSATVSIAVDRVGMHRQSLDEAAAKEVVLTQAKELRTALLAAVGHDLRSPLATAKASIGGLLSSELDLSEQDQEELLVSADGALDQLTAVVVNLLDMSRLHTGALTIALQPTDVAEQVARAIAITSPDGGVRTHVPATLPAVLADPGLLERVLANLLANALRYSPSNVPPRVEATQDGDQISIRVIDHGPGVPVDQFERIFTPFQREGDTDLTTGLGLGLALSRGLAEAMGGGVVAESTPGGGLTLVVRLASAPETPSEPGRRERLGDPA
jgi:two-component system sensor histidine kinase KdpD